MGDEGPHAHHLRREALYEQQVLHDIIQRLIGRADHRAAAHLISDLLQAAQAFDPVCERKFRRVQTAQPVFPAHLRRMDPAVMGRARRLVAQQVAVGSGVIKALIALPRFFAERERYRAVRIRGANGADDVRHYIVCVVHILSALKHEGAEAEAVARLTAAHDILLRQAVALSRGVAAANAAVIAVVPAIICHFDEPAYIYLVPEMRARGGACQLEEPLGNILIAVLYEPAQLLARGVVIPVKGFYYLCRFHSIHSRIEKHSKCSRQL